MAMLIAFPALQSISYIEYHLQKVWADEIDRNNNNKKRNFISYSHVYDGWQYTTIYLHWYFLLSLTIYELNNYYGKVNGDKEITTTIDY